MTIDPNDVLSHNLANHTYVNIASGENARVSNGGPIMVSPSIQLKNCLVFLNLPYKLLSVSQMTKELN